MVAMRGEGSANKGENSSQRSVAPLQTPTGVQTMSWVPIGSSSSSTPSNHNSAGLLEDADEDNAQTVK